MAPSTMSLKLLVDNKTNKVLFAEAGKDFVDFVFGILRIHIAVSVGAMHTLGSVGRLYQSVADLGAAYFLPSADKRDLLQPKVLLQGDNGRELLDRFKMYTCPSRCLVVTMATDAECPRCGEPMAAEMAYVLPSSTVPRGGDDVGADGAASASGGESGGYVNGLVTYMVTDGLDVTPLTSGITLINRFSVNKDVDLAEKSVDVGRDEVLALIEVALRSDTVLSDVFLARKKVKLMLI